MLLTCCKKKRVVLIIATLFLLVVASLFSYYFITSKRDSNEDAYTRAIATRLKKSVLGEQLALERRGYELRKKGEYVEAVLAYQKALSVARSGEYYSVKHKNRAEATAHGALMRLFVLLKKYDLALEEAEWFSVISEDHSYLVRYKSLIMTLKKYDEAGDKRPVYETIDWFKREYKSDLPPKGFDAHIFGIVVFLYDHIGAYDEGVNFAKSLYQWFSDLHEWQTGPLTVAEADACMQENIISPGRVKPDWDKCRVLREFLTVREGFEKDKREGTTGRARHALEVSDFLGW